MLLVAVVDLHLSAVHLVSHTCFVYKLRFRLAH